MRVLNLSSDYSRQRLYSEFITKMQSIGIKQDVYVPVRSMEEIGKYDISGLRNTTINYAHILRKYHRLLFHKKIKDTFDSLKSKVKIKGIDLIHAQFLFSDGAVALRLKNDFQIPFIVTVRNTDVNVFFKYMLHLRKLGIKIMFEAEHIIFITPAYVDKVIDQYVPEYYNEKFRSKISIIPNGVDEFWLQNKSTTGKESSNIIKLLYVGDFTKNKNLLSVIKATKELSKENVAISLTIVGGGGDGEKAVLKEIKKVDPLLIQYVGRVEEITKILKYYKTNDIFIMPSFMETFGLVYLEAMSQGLPIIFTQGQGVDGYFDLDSPGYAVNPHSIQDIKNKILKVNKNLTKLSQNSLKHIDRFGVDNAVLKYNILYKNTLKK